MLKKLLLVTLTLLIILSVSACEKDEDAGKIGEMAEINETKPFENPFFGDSDLSRPKAAEIEKISYAYKGNEIPESFPNDLPVYSPAKVTSCRILENNKGAIAVLLTRDSTDKIAEFYLSFAKEKNWEIEDKLMTENIFSLLAKNDASTISISAAKETNGTAITLAIALNEK